MVVFRPGILTVVVIVIIAFGCAALRANKPPQNPCHNEELHPVAKVEQQQLFVAALEPNEAQREQHTALDQVQLEIIQDGDKDTAHGEVGGAGMEAHRREASAHLVTWREVQADTKFTIQ